MFPEFAAETDSRVDRFIDVAGLSVAEGPWGNMADTAKIYLTAHLLAMANRGQSGASGPVTGEKVGDLSRNYADMTSVFKNELAATPYGVEYLRLRRQVLVTPMVTC